MERMRTIVQASAVYRVLAAPVPVVRRAMEGQRAHSVVHPPPLQLEQAESDHECLCPALAVDPRRTVPPVPGPAPGQAV